MAKAISKPLALAVAVGLTLGGSFGVGAPAFAQEARQTSRGAATIPQGENFSLTLHKRLNAQQLFETDGEINPNAGGQPLPGVEFRIQKLAGNVRDQAGLSHLATVADEFNKSNGSADTPPLDPNGPDQTGETQQNGEVTFGNLPAGAYLVTETKTPATDGAQAFVKSKPFIVFVPMTNPNGIGWNSDVHIYPKNSAVRVDKQVEDADKHAEDPLRDPDSKIVTYTLDGLVPAAPQRRILSNFKLTDSSRSDELRFEDNFIESVQRIPAGGTADDAENLPEGTYQVNRDVPLPTNTQNLAEGANQTFEVVVPDPQAANLQAGDTLHVTVKATMLKAADQQIENSVNESGIFRDPNTGAEDEGFETPNDKVVSYIGDIRVVKVDEQNEEKRLEGAAFDLFRCDDEKDIIQTGTTNRNGEILFEGIHVTDWENGAAPERVLEYCLRETDAPAGYTILEDAPRRITLTINSQENNAEGQTIRMVSATFKNRPTSDIPVLPSTGGMGILLVALLGLGIIAGGVYAARRNSVKA
ncbi:LPXTG cell wall anchor domain-containing protein [Corynebacterium diphtheriae]|nr:LPXTG cell wall anchor domain-containing protein [Corynebacterium diphtheriae]